MLRVATVINPEEAGRRATKTFFTIGVSANEERNRAIIKMHTIEGSASPIVVIIAPGTP